MSARDQGLDRVRHDSDREWPAPLAPTPAQPMSTPVTVKERGETGAHASRFARVDAWFEARGAGQPLAMHEPATAELAPSSATRRRVRHADHRRGSRRHCGGGSAPQSSTRQLGQVATNAERALSLSPEVGTVEEGDRQLSRLPSGRCTIGDCHARAQRARGRRAGGQSTSSANCTARSGWRARGGLGKARAPVVIYAMSGGERAFRVATRVRANAKGQFRYRYRFRNSAPGVRYRFRALMHSGTASVRHRQFAVSHGANPLSDAGRSGIVRLTWLRGHRRVQK